MRVRITLATAVLCAAVMLATHPAWPQSRPAPPGDRSPTSRPTASRGHDFGKWEKEISAFEAEDRASPPPQGAALFIGSSTIRMWTTLDKDFPGQRTINRGFGGSEIADSTHFAERIIFPCKPRIIFLRAGGNDIHAGKSPEQVFADYQAFVAKVHARLPDAQIAFISISPAPARWAERHAYKVLNAMVQKYARRKPWLKYIETYDMVLAPNGQARPELFIADKLHFSAEGYKLLAERVRPFMTK